MYQPPQQNRPPHPDRPPHPGQPQQPLRPQQQPYPGRQPYPPQPGHYQQQPQHPPQPPAKPPKQKKQRPPGRQRHWPYMLMLVVLLPLIAGFEYWVEEKDNALPAEFDQPAVVVAKGGTGDYKGATWKLTKFGIIPAPKDTKLPRGTRLLQATFEVTPRTAKASKAIQYCAFKAVDDQPRVWDTLVSDTCEVKKGKYEKVAIPAGQTQKVTAAFLVPTDAADKVRARVLLGKDGPLEFAR